MNKAKNKSAIIKPLSRLTPCPGLSNLEGTKKIQTFLGEKSNKTGQNYQMLKIVPWRGLFFA